MTQLNNVLAIVKSIDEDYEKFDKPCYALTPDDLEFILSCITELKDCSIQLYDLGEYHLKCEVDIKIDKWRLLIVWGK